jgi:hypothetical protein
MLRDTTSMSAKKSVTPNTALLENGTIISSSTTTSFKAKPYGRFLKTSPAKYVDSYINYYNDSDDYIQKLNNDDINKNYEGFCIDLLKIMAEKIGFDFRLELVPDGKYGVFNQNTGEWNVRIMLNY